MQVLITGCRGGIGRAVVRELRRSGAATVGLDLGGAQEPESAAERPDRFVGGEVADRERLRAAMAGCDAVVHLAAIPSPDYPDPVELFGRNTTATFEVLYAAHAVGGPAVVLASSVSALGLAWSPGPASPDYVPIDEQHPLRPLDPYGVGKACDEALARMAAGRWGLRVLSLRYPYTATARQIEDRAAAVAVDPAEAAKELWAYLDIRDAAAATRLAVEYVAARSGSGWRSITVAAADLLSDRPLPELLARYHPGTEVRADMSRTPPYDPSPAETVLGFRPLYRRARPTSG